MSAHASNHEADRILGPARLAFFTPIHHQPVLADRKAAFLLAASGLIATVLMLFGAAIGRLVQLPRGPGVLILLLLFVLAGLLLVVVWCAWRCFILPIPPMPASLAYFPHIGALDLPQYRGSIRQLDQQAAVRAILHYNYSLSIQSVRKYRLANRGFACFRIALMLWLLLLLLISIAG
jgi:hypothetical protein